MTDMHGIASVSAMTLLAAGLLLVPDPIRLPTPVGAPELFVPPARPIGLATLVAVALALAGVSLAPGWWWLIVPVAGLVGALVARSSRGTSSADRAADRRLVAVYAELLASCLDTGMAVVPALRAVSAVLAGAGPPGRSVGPSGNRSGGGPPGHPSESGWSQGGPPEKTRNAAAASWLRADRPAGPLLILDSVAAMLSLGADPGTAWRRADVDDLLAPLAAAARRSAAGGGALAAAVREHAVHLRQETTAASVRSAGRAGVLMTAPLGVCFLPAFLCLGLAPVVVGLLGQLNIF